MKSAEQTALCEGLRWALKYVRLPDGEDPEAWSAEYNAARQALAVADNKTATKTLFNIIAPTKAKRRRGCATGIGGVR